MIQENAAVQLEDGTIKPKEVIQIVCRACSYDLQQNELSASNCPKCATPLKLKRSVAINVTSKPIGTKVWGQ
jgi:predicted Zn-ribbon and HTH transcriptional regulator